MNIAYYIHLFVTPLCFAWHAMILIDEEARTKLSYSYFVVALANDSHS